MTTSPADRDATDAAASDATDSPVSDAPDGADRDPRSTVPTTVPADADAVECPYCDRPFTGEDRVALHVGLEHYDVCTDAEEEAFAAAYRAENEEIRRYRLKAAAALIVLYFGLLMVYAVAA